MTTLRSEDVDEEIRKGTCHAETIGLSPLRGSSVYRAWNPGPRGTGLTIWRRSAAGFVSELQEPGLTAPCHAWYTFPQESVQPERTVRAPRGALGYPLVASY